MSFIDPVETDDCRTLLAVAWNSNTEPETLQQIVEKSDDWFILRAVTRNSNATPETLDIVNKKIG